MLPLQFETTTPASVGEIVSLLREALQLKTDGPNLELDLLLWKYYAAGPAWAGSRSYALRRGSQMVAHAGVWPIRLATSGGWVGAIQMVDWAAAKSSPGAGVALARKLGTLAPVMITTGGSEDTHEVLPLIGFTRRAAVEVFARVVRPWKQFRSRPPARSHEAGIKDAAKLARNTVWSMSALAPRRDWTAEPSPPDSELFSRLEAQPAVLPESRHSPEFIEFLTRCPGACVRYFALLKAGRAQGYFVLSRLGGQTRLADLRILSSEPADWSAAYATATATAAADPEACELTASAAVPVAAAALRANQFRFRGTVPIFVRDPGGLLGGAEHIHLGMLDDDSAFLDHPGHPYST